MVLVPVIVTIYIPRHSCSSVGYSLWSMCVGAVWYDDWLAGFDMLNDHL